MVITAVGTLRITVAGPIGTAIGTGTECGSIKNMAYSRYEPTGHTLTLSRPQRRQCHIWAYQP